MGSTGDGWERLAQRDEVAPGAPLTSELGENGIGVYEVDGELYALEDICPHGPSLLSRGYVWNGMVKCPLHGAVFDIRTGKCLQGPAERDLQTYPVQIRDDGIYVQIEAQQQHETESALESDLGSENGASENGQNCTL